MTSARCCFGLLCAALRKGWKVGCSGSIGGCGALGFARIGLAGGCAGWVADIRGMRRDRRDRRDRDRAGEPNKNGAQGFGKDDLFDR